MASAAGTQDALRHRQGDALVRSGSLCRSVPRRVAEQRQTHRACALNRGNSIIKLLIGQRPRRPGQFAPLLLTGSRHTTQTEAA